jgi:hypothetical protein
MSLIKSDVLADLQRVSHALQEGINSLFRLDLREPRLLGHVGHELRFGHAVHPLVGIECPLPRSAKGLNPRGIPVAVYLTLATWFGRHKGRDPQERRFRYEKPGSWSSKWIRTSAFGTTAASSCLTRPLMMCP